MANKEGKERLEISFRRPTTILNRGIGCKPQTTIGRAEHVVMTRDELDEEIASGRIRPHDLLLVTPVSRADKLRRGHKARKKTPPAESARTTARAKTKARARSR